MKKAYCLTLYKAQQFYIPREQLQYFIEYGFNPTDSFKMFCVCGKTGDWNQSWSERLDICTIDITPRFMLTLTYSNLHVDFIATHNWSEIGIIYHIML